MQQHNIQPTQDMLNALLRTSSVSTTATTTLSPSYLKSFFKSSNKGNLLDKEGYISFIQAFINSGDIESAQRAALQLKKRTFTIGTSSHMAIVQGWVRQGQMTKAETWLEKCNYIKWVSKGKCQSVLDPYAIIAEGYLQTGEWGRCVNLLEVVKKEVPTIAQQNRRMIKAALVARFARGDFYVCERILMEKQADFTPVTIQRIVQTMLGIKNKSVPGQTVVKGLELMETMLDVRVTATGLGRIIEKLGERGDLRAAYELYRRVRNERRPLGFVIYRSMMEAAVNNNNVVMAERIIYHMNRSSSSISTNNNPLQRSSCPTLSSYNMLLNAYASRQPEPHLSRMTRTFRRLLADGHRPDVTTYNTLIKAFIQMDNQSAALSIFQEMKTAGYRGNSWTINTLIQGWIAQMDWHGLEKFILEIKADEYTLDTITFNLMLEGLLRLNKYEIRLARLWKRQNRWPKLKQLQQRQQEANNSLSSEAVWEIFESSLGISITEGSNTGAEVMSNHQGSHDDGNSNNSSSNEDAKTSGHSDNNNSRMDHQEVYRFLLQHQKNSVQMSPQTTSSRTAFYTLFQNAKPDEVTFKLFMKAFQNANDPESAAKIHHYWMNQSKDH
ncbi:hypothetical protein BDA99DRAFT_437456 [Phascolomyces articulosus]|uniref:Pentacotripeptide-repeat region of PRORP domain-containing protein n=1 Tax=Phascolomyces articulosus TaxID=60185 RepID=A0AAD5K151_9FUNG|nr:hypothetical protein BDA99DRAFT_437456 [Phascolomyces articulosus]